MGTCVVYRFIIKKPAKKFIDGLPMNERRRIVDAIERLPDNGDIKRIQGHDDLFRLRIQALTGSSTLWTMESS